MGVTIHFEGKLKDEASYDSCVDRVRTFAEPREWVVLDIESAVRELSRVRDEKPWDYVGSTKGIAVIPHPDSEPLRFEFDNELFVQEYIKTQFAPIDTHIDVVRLLREMQELFVVLRVEDEGEYYPADNVEQLDAHRQTIERLLMEMLAEDKTATGPVRLPSGRIADFVRD